MRIVEQVRRLEEYCYLLGLRMSRSPHSHSYSSTTSTLIALMPNDDSFPAHSRDAIFATGDLNEIECWLEGLMWARKYDENILRITSQRKRRAAEDRFKHRSLLQTLKTGKRVQDPLRELEDE